MVSSERIDADQRLTGRANRAQFMDVALRHINEDEDIVQVSMPTIQGDQDSTGKLEACQALPTDTQLWPN